MKSCFIIMPISDGSHYTIGHFKRVYEYIIKPACENAGFNPVRADDVMHTNLIALDIIKKVIESDMAICDLSGRNPNVLYELGIRQAFNKPVTFIKDKTTDRIFDIQGFRDIEYDESLRIDTVENAINSLTETITNTYNNHDKETNSLVSLLGINAATLKNVQISSDTEIILNSISAFSERIMGIERRVNEMVIPSFSTTLLSDSKPGVSKYYSKAGVSEEIIDNYAIIDTNEAVEINEIVYNKNFGIGRIINITGNGNSQILQIDFGKHGSKNVLRKYITLMRPLNKLKAET